MKTDELKNIWIDVEGVFTPIAKDELNGILVSKIKKSLSKFKGLLTVSILLCVGVMVFLTIASISLWGDFFYLANNALLAVIILTLLIYYIRGYKELNLTSLSEHNLYESLRVRAEFLSDSLRNKKELLLLPFLLITLIISINGFYTTGSFLGIFQDMENLWGLIFGLPIGIAVAFYVARKVSRLQKKELDIMKNYLQELESEQ